MAIETTITRRDGLTVHTCTADEAGWRANSHVLEFDDHLVLVDAPLLAEDAQQVQVVLARLDKPLRSVVVTHAHPDHYATLPLFDVPASALPAVREAVNAQGAAVRAGTYALLGVGSSELAPPQIAEAFATGEQTFGGVPVVVTDLQHAETGHQLVLAFPDQGVLMVGDVVFHDVHAFVAERDFTGWAAALDVVESLPFDTVVPGHGRPGGRELYAPMRDYLEQTAAFLDAADDAAQFTAALRAAHAQLGGTAMWAVQNRYLFP